MRNRRVVYTLVVVIQVYFFVVFISFSDRLTSLPYVNSCPLSQSTQQEMIFVIHIKRDGALQWSPDIQDLHVSSFSSELLNHLDRDSLYPKDQKLEKGMVDVGSYHGSAVQSMYVKGTVPNEHSIARSMTGHLPFCCARECWCVCVLPQLGLRDLLLITNRDLTLQKLNTGQQNLFLTVSTANKNLQSILFLCWSHSLAFKMAP